MSRLHAVRDAVAQVLAPHLGPETGRERAAHIAQLWAFEPLTEASASEIIRQSRAAIYGGVPVSDVEADSLAARVLLLLDGLG